MNTPLDTALLDALLRAARADGVAKHVVGAVIADREDRVLLLHRTADDYFGGLWELPSGGVEEGESLTEALHREVAEETGLALAGIGAYLGHFDYLSRSGRKTRQFNFTATALHEKAPVELAPHEHDAHRWADRTQQEQVSSAVRVVLAHWREGDHAREGGRTVEP
ncbi:NUDIX hydrolase [Streptomyces sp. ODS28]|uniref:NUDIX hydrolase n=1 Tax=Streptomyces sp. ODS28 TaxID=3136688 RepID=UPI0031E77621